MNELLFDNLSNLNIKINNEQLDILNNYINILLKWNKAYNLTAAKNYKELIFRHILDSVMPQNYINTINKNWLDVGSGAGMPAIILAILNPNKNLTLLDSNGKKTRFLSYIKYNLNLTNIKIIQTRIENFQTIEKFDLIMSRAFSNLLNFLNLTKKFSHQQTKWLTFKSSNYLDELNQITTQFKLQNKIKYKLPTCNQAYILILKGVK